MVGRLVGWPTGVPVHSHNCKEAAYGCRNARIEGAPHPDGPRVSRPRGPPSRPRFAAPRTFLPALPDRTRTTRRNAAEEAEASAEGQDGRHRASLSGVTT